MTHWYLYFSSFFYDFLGLLSGEFWVPQANQDLVKIKNLYFPYWAWSTPLGHVLSLITFRQIPVLSWAIRFSVFQKVKFTSRLQKWAGNFNSNYWHLVVRFRHNGWFKAHFQNDLFQFQWNKQIMILSFVKQILKYFFNDSKIYKNLNKIFFYIFF